MSVDGNSMQKTAAVESDAGFEVLDDWLRLENENTDPGFLLPDRETVIAWCEGHSGTVLLSANTLLWAPIIWAMCQG